MRTSFLFVIALLMAWCAFADIHQVSPGESIQQAVNQSVDGDTVLIEDGAYVETVVLYGKTLTIGSYYLLNGDTSHVQSTVIQSDDNRPDTNSCFVYAYGEENDSRLVGLTLTHGRGTRWAQVPGYSHGGALFISGSAVSAERSRMVSCTADYGGGMAVVASFPADTSTHCNLLDCVVSGCVSSGGGGGVYIYGSHFQAGNTVFEADTSYACGGGGAIDGLTITASIASCRFVSNSSGFGAVLLGLGTNNITNCVFAGNGANSEDGWTDLYLVDCNAVVTQCVFDSNSTSEVGLFLSEYSFGKRIDFIGNVICNHETLNSSGPIILYNYRNGEFAYNLIRDNHGWGAALFIWQGVRRIHHNIFLRNTCSSGTRSAIYVQRPQDDSLDAVIDSNLFLGNNGNSVGSAFDLNGARHPVHAENNWWGDPTGPYHPTLNPTGQGDTILQDSTYFIPWLTEPPDTTMPPGYLSVREPREIPSTWHLLECYPNPFNSSIRIILAGFAGNDFEITLHNLLGQEVDVIHRGPLTGGQIIYQAPPQLASGVYFLRASDRTAVQSRKIILMK